MKKTLSTLFVLAYAGLIGTVHAAEGATPPPAATGQEQKAKSMEKKQEKKQEKKDKKQEKKQIHKKDTSATPATPAEPAKK